MADEEHFNLLNDITIAIPPNEEEDEVRINVDSMAASFENMMSQKLTMSYKRCIFRIPCILRRHNEKAYIPNAFAIGPWHHNTEKLKPTEKIKLNYLHGLLSRSPCRETRLKQFINAIARMEEEARKYYAGPIDVNVDKFVQILILDGCFLIELFRKNDDWKLRGSDDPIFNVACMLQYLCHDLVLLENQIPWIVLESLFNMTRNPESKPLVQLAHGFFKNFFSRELPSSADPHVGPKHMLDLLRAWLVGKEEDVGIGWRPMPWRSMPSATNLLDAGIKFRPVISESILNINFNDGALEIPPFMIHEITEVMIRNLISYEQCTPNCSARITSYAILLDNLINTTKDMDILCQNKIIDNWLNPEDATQFFNKLYHDATISRYYYCVVCEKVNEHCGHRWPKWRAMCMRNYFGTPWAIISLIVASTFLILAILQTIFSILK